MLSTRCDLVNTVTVMNSSQVRALAPTFSGFGPITCTQEHKYRISIDIAIFELTMIVSTGTCVLHAHTL